MMKGVYHDIQVFEVYKSASFERWIRGLKDRQAARRVNVRIDRLAAGNAGDADSVGDGISEMRIHYGPGYRVYFMRRGTLVVVLLCGGDKGSQQRDIERAKRIARDWKDGK